LHTYEIVCVLLIILASSEMKSSTELWLHVCILIVDLRFWCNLYMITCCYYIYTHTDNIWCPYSSSGQLLPPQYPKLNSNIASMPLAQGVSQIPFDLVSPFFYLYLLYQLYILSGISYIYSVVSAVYTLWYQLYILSGISYIYSLVLAIYTLWCQLYILSGVSYIYSLVSAIYTLWYQLYTLSGVSYIYTLWC